MLHPTQTQPDADQLRRDRVYLDVERKAQAKRIMPNAFAIVPGDDGFIAFKTRESYIAWTTGAV